MQSTVNQTVLDKKVTGDNVELAVKLETQDAKGKTLEPKEYKVECVDGVFKVDMSYFLDPEMLKNYQSMEVSVSGDALEMPSDMAAGQTLNDGQINVAVGMGGTVIMNMYVNITNRKVEGKESITTPAGTFDCFKITYTIETKFGVKIERNTVEWIAKNVGTVRSESYKGDKLEGYTELTKLGL